MMQVLFSTLLVFVIPLNIWATSLWLKSGNDQRGLFGGKRAYAVGDLITIDVAESSSLAASQNSVRTANPKLKMQLLNFFSQTVKWVLIMEVCRVLKLNRKRVIRAVGQFPILRT